MPRKANIPAGDAYWKREWEMQKLRGEDKKQAERGKARRAYDKAGIDRKGKQIDHITPLAAGGTSTKGNLRLRSVKANEADNGHKKGEKAGIKRAK